MFQNGESQANMSRDNSVPQPTVCGQLKDDFVDTIDPTDGMKRKKTRTANDPELDKAVFTWFVKKRQGGITISGPVLSLQAHTFHIYMEAILLYMETLLLTQ